MLMLNTKILLTQKTEDLYGNKAMPYAKLKNTSNTKD